MITWEHTDDILRVKAGKKRDTVQVFKEKPVYTKHWQDADTRLNCLGEATSEIFLPIFSYLPKFF